MCGCFLMVEGFKEVVNEMVGLRVLERWGIGSFCIGFIDELIGYSVLLCLVVWCVFV